MTHICYSEDKEPFRGKPVPYDQQNACSHWTRHYSNSKLLRFMLTSPDSTFAEKRQAQKELEICDRKLLHWQKHPNFSPDLATQTRGTIDQQWRAK